MLRYSIHITFILILFSHSLCYAIKPFSSYEADKQALNVSSDNASTELTQPKRSFIASIENRLVTFVHTTVNNIRYSAYKLGGRHFDFKKGIYVLDCSSYVDYILQTIYPRAYFNLVNFTRSEKPTSQHYFDFINELPDDPKYYWSKVNEVNDLRPGDILVFRYRKSKHAIGGHVMMVMDEPIHNDNNAWLVKVADSAPTGHSNDTRARHVSGIGIGTLLLKTNPHNGQLAAYAWKTGAAWKHNVNFAMARPMGFVK